jgi:hypothetical protein
MLANEKSPDSSRTMPDASDRLPRTSIGRFAAGLGLASLVTFVGLLVYGPPASTPDACVRALAPALFFGLVVGILSAFSRKCLSFFVALLTRFGF